MNRDEFIAAIAEEYCRSSNHRGGNTSRCEYGEQAGRAALTVLDRLDKVDITVLFLTDAPRRVLRFYDTDR